MELIIVNQDSLRNRTKTFVETLNLPISRLAKSVGFERSTYYRWVKGEFDLGERLSVAIDEYLKKFGF